MEIKPYRSQVRETPTPEPTNTRINTLGAQSYAAWGSMISQAGQNTASSMYKLNDAMQRKRDADDDMAYRAICQDIDQAFLNFGNQTADFFQQDANDPNKVFYEDKSTYDKFYQDGINQIQINTIDKVKNPRVQEAARLYFNQKKMEAGQKFLVAYDQNKKNAEALVFGRELDDKVQKAIGAKWDEDIALYKDDIAKTVNDMASRGMIRKDQIEDVIKDANKKIEYGRATNVLDSLINADRYEDAQKFMDAIPEKDMDEGAKQALQDHFKDRMGIKKNILERQRGKVYNEGIDLYNKGELTREWIDGNKKVLGVYPELDLNTDYNTFFRGLLEAKEKLAEQEAKSEAATKKAGELEEKTKKSDAAYKAYFNKIDIILRGDGTDEEKQAALEKLWEQIKADPDLDQKQDVERLAGFMGVKPGTKSGSGTKSKEKDLGYESDLAEFVRFVIENRAASEDVRKDQFARWFPSFLKKHPEAADDLPKFNSMLENAAKLITLPEIASLQDTVNDKIKEYHDAGKTDKEMALRSANKSFFQVIAEDMWWKLDSKGQRVETDEPYRQKIFAEAKSQIENLLKADSILDALNGVNMTARNPRFETTSDGYSMTVDGDYNSMKDSVVGSKLFKYTEEGKNFFGQLADVEMRAISEALDINMTGFQQIVDPETNKVFYFKEETEDEPAKMFTIDRNARGDWNIYRIYGNNYALQIPDIIKRERELPPAEPFKPGSTVVSKVGSGELSNAEAVEKAGTAVKKGAKFAGGKVKEGIGYLVEKTQGKR